MRARSFFYVSTRLTDETVMREARRSTGRGPEIAREWQESESYPAVADPLVDLAAFEEAHVHHSRRSNSSVTSSAR
jgi:hypothetical protein